MNRREFIETTGRITAAATVTGGLFSTFPTCFSAEVKPSESTSTRPLRVVSYGGAQKAVQPSLAKQFQLKTFAAGQRPGSAGDAEDNVVGLENLDEADLWVGSGNKRNNPSDAQLAHFKKFLAAGKPFVGYRAASHIFQNWLQQDQAVWGATYGGHHLLGKEKELVVRPTDGALDHPVLKDIAPPAPTSGSYNYTQLQPDVRVLLYSGLVAEKSRTGKDDFQPHTWVRENKQTGGRAFYTRYDSSQIAADPVCAEIFIRGILWALGSRIDQFSKGTG